MTLEDAGDTIKWVLETSDEYQKYFDLEVAMNDFEEAYRTILAAVKKLSTESQWVPLNWVYS